MRPNLQPKVYKSPVISNENMNSMLNKVIKNTYRIISYSSFIGIICRIPVYRKKYPH
jgi:hypothetical protein